MKTILLALSMLFAVGCIETETKEHFVTCTEQDICPNRSSCQDGVCVEEAGACSADKECPEGGICQNGLCHAQIACYLSTYRGGFDGDIAQTPGPNVNLLAYRIERHGPTTPECVPEFLDTVVIIMVTPPESFTPQVEMRINGEKQTRFWLSDSDTPFDVSNWSKYWYAWEGDLVIQTPLGEPVINTVEINCTNCNASMPAGISIFSHVYSYSWRKNSTGEVLYNQGGIELDRLITFPR